MSDILQAAHETARDLHAAGVMDGDAMRRVDRACAPEAPSPRRFGMRARWLAALVCIPLALALAGWLLLFPPFPRPPEIARGLPAEFAAAQEEFARRVADRFALPMETEALADQLEEEGFAVDRAAGSASFSKSSFPCTLRWRVNWTSLGDTVQTIYPRYGGVCL